MAIQTRPRDRRSVRDGTGVKTMRAETGPQAWVEGDVTDLRERAVQALVDLAACFPYAWERRPVPGLRLAVRDSASSTETLVSVDGGWYVAAVGAEEPPGCLAAVGRPGEAVEALVRRLAASGSGSGSSAGFAVVGGGV